MKNVFEGVPRSDLEAEVRVLRKTVAAVVGERDDYLKQLGVVQAECTRLLAIDRVMKELRPLAERILHARAKHPEGANFPALLREVEEVRDELICGNDARYVDELFDVATICMRIIWSERAPEYD